jgi:hypothetical protein
MKVVKSEKALKDPYRLREIKEEAREYQQYFAKMRAHILERAVPSYVLSDNSLDMQVVYTLEVQQRLDWIEKTAGEEMRRLQKQVLDAGYDIIEPMD